MLEIAILAIVIALIFDFVNGFNDSANSVATVIGTRVLRPLHAVALSAAANFAGPFIFGVAVATTIAKGIVSPDEITVYMIIGGLAGAIAWSSLCTYFGLPISNSHSLIGGIMGAGIAGLGFEQLVLGGLTKVFAGIIIAPIGGMIFGIALAGAIIVFLAKRRPAIVNRTFVRVTRLRPYQGFAAETGGGMMLAIFAIFGIPASTTHAITGTIMGAGAARRKRAVRWKVSRQIIFSWVITIPGAAGLGIGFTYIIHLFV
jgi:phosphate/sulfate permease